ncbi:lipoprotein localization factor LolB, partial [Burkholderia multivorans]
PPPATPAETERDPADGTRLKQIRQDGWTIDYLAYADAPATGVRRVNLVRATPPLDIKLVLDQ